MATRVNRKNPTSAASREVVPAEKLTKNEPNDDVNGGVSSRLGASSVGKNLVMKSSSKRVAKKTSIGIKLKAKAKQTVKINKKLKRKILQGAKSSENRRKPVRNGLRESKALRTNIKKEIDDTPPVLEPITPIVEPENTTKKQKKRTKTQTDSMPPALNVKKVKVEIDDETLACNNTEDQTNVIETNRKPVKKQRGTKKNKNANEAIEGTSSDVSFLIKKEDIKTEVDSMSESGKNDVTKIKRITRQQKMEPLEYEPFEDLEAPPLLKEDIKVEPDAFLESEHKDMLKSKKTFKNKRIELLKKHGFKKEKLDEVDEKVIDVLDLNVTKIKRKSLSKRRHSIEKFPMGSLDSTDMAMSQLFNHTPRSLSPRSKRHTKVRQSSDSISRRSSPYSTRSDSPARILRNGKQRKWIDLNLIEGLETDVKKRKRLCSDLSGSEMSVSKLSEYESDSSFSDLASFHSIENTEDLPVKVSSFKDSFEEAPVDISDDVTEKNTCKNLEIIDTNSNVCNNLNKFEPKMENIEETHESDDLVKVPDKSVILDIMKKAFNETVSDKIETSSTCSTTEENQIESLEIKDNQENVVTIATNPNKNDYDETDFKYDVKVDLEDSNQKIDIPEDDQSQTVADIEEDKNCKDQNDIVEVLSYIIDNVEKIECHSSESSELENRYECSEPKKTLTSEDINALENDENAEKSILKENASVETVSLENGEPDFEMAKIENPIKECLEMEEENVESDPLALVDPEVMKEDNLVDSKEMELVEDNEVIDENTLNHTSGSGNNTSKDSLGDVTEKESILKALGLQSLKAAEHSKQLQLETFNRTDIYTGTLKTVIKLNRDKKKGGRISAPKMILQTNRNKGTVPEVLSDDVLCKDSEEVMYKHETASSDLSCAARKSHTHRSNTDETSENVSDSEGTSQDDTIKALVIPEKASSFSIHPGRLCKDECSYCFGKFGLFDTPCHIAQMKSVDRQDKILATEKHLTRDSCLCDACYRHVDRKSNTPSYMNKSLKRNSLVAPGPKENHCHVLGCSRLATNILRRKWIIKMKKSVCQVINIDLDNPGLHSIPICDGHYSALEHLMICSMCKRRLARNHIHYLGPETNALNSSLMTEGIPITLTDKPVVCKLCKCFASIILKDAEERSENSINFFNEYKRRLLHFNDILPMDESAAEEPISFPSKSDKLDQHKKKKKLGKTSSDLDSANSMENIDEKSENILSPETNDNEPKSRSESPVDEYNVVDYNTLIPAIAMDCGSDSESKKEPLKAQPVIIKKIIRNDKSQDAVEISKVYKSNINKSKSDIAVQKLGSNPSISVRQLFPGEEDLPLDVQIDFQNVKDHTPEGWEKCTSVIQYDTDTKRLWQELQKPYGNQSSFLRHLILLEKYFRNGDLVLSANASHHSINYSESVHNRLRAYDNISASAKNVQPLSMIPFNKMHEKYSTEAISNTNVITSQSSPSNQRTLTNSTVNRLTSNNPSVTVTPQPVIHRGVKSNAALTITQLNNPVLTSGSTVLQQIRPKMVSAPPGLISLNPGSTRPVNPLIKVPQSQKIKFPITKNWRPNLIPIDPTKKQERKAGLVQVISGGKPYHITLEDYKKMCAIKRSFEMKQKRLQEVQNAKPILVTHNSVLKSIIPRKGLIISKAVPTNVPVKEEQSVPSSFSNGEHENILQKLDKQVEKLDAKLNEKTLPRIPKSLTVIPQSISKPSSPVLEITTKVSSKS